MKVIWTDYMRYRTSVRGYDPSEIEDILSYSNEHYFDAVTGRHVVIGRHSGSLVMIPYEEMLDAIVPITIHATSRQQINARLRTGRFQHV